MRRHNEAAERRAGERPHRKTKKFDGLIFTLWDGEAMSEQAANNSATYWRNRGYLVRVVKEPGHPEWLIYRRKKSVSVRNRAEEKMTRKNFIRVKTTSGGSRLVKVT
jgi:hypothetical protein